MDVKKLMVVALAGWINSLRGAVDQFWEHYHRDRNHQGLESRIIEPDFGSEGGLNCRSRLGEMLRYYHRDAA